MGRDEQGKLLALIYRRKFTEPTILVMDRGYESYNTIAHCCNIPNFFFVLRVKQRVPNANEELYYKMRELFNHPDSSYLDGVVFFSLTKRHILV